MILTSDWWISMILTSDWLQVWAKPVLPAGGGVHGGLVLPRPGPAAQHPDGRHQVQGQVDAEASVNELLYHKKRLL